MPTYVIGGKKIKTETELNESQIDEIASSLGVSKEQPSVAAPSSGFLMGIKDPISAGAQLLPRGLEQVTSLGGLAPNPVSRFFGSEAQRVDEMVRAEEAAYQQQRAAQGETGFDSVV